MDFSDILSIISILVTIVVGFILTRRFAIYDSRNRAIKDYYINELSEISEQLCLYYGQLKTRKISGQHFVNNINELSSKIKSLDKGLKNAFAPYVRGIGDLSFNLYKQLTKEDEFNNEFTQEGGRWPNSFYRLIVDSENKINDRTHQLVDAINNCPNKTIIHKKYDQYIQEFNYYNEQKRFCCYILRLIKRLLITACIIGSVCLAIQWSIKKFKVSFVQKDVERDEVLKDIARGLYMNCERLDSINYSLIIIRQQQKLQKSIPIYVQIQGALGQDSVQQSTKYPLNR